MFGKGHICQEREPREWCSNTPGYNMHGWLMLGEMTWTRQGHSGLLEHLRTSCGTPFGFCVYFVMDFTFAELL